jgi:hypothetical protein
MPLNIVEGRIEEYRADAVRGVDFVADSMGFRGVSENVGDALCSMRVRHRPMSKARMNVFMEKIREDHKKRSGKHT